MTGCPGISGFDCGEGVCMATANCQHPSVRGKARPARNVEWMSNHQVDVEISIARYIIRPHPTNDGRVFVEVQRVDDRDGHDHPVGPALVIDLDSYFKERLKP